ncbi:MAG TPA: DUF222 domain-containing protein [Nocardioides sp.]|nr:DUF222 domain-containing protein [Nocardioides sp.]
MSISDLPSSPSPVSVLGDVVEAVRELHATWWTHQSDDDLVAAVELVEQARSALAAVQAGAVSEADHRDLGKKRLHYGSTGDWLTHLGGLRKGEGRRIVARAHALMGSLAATREALAAGRVSPEQADVIVRSVDALPSGTAVRVRGEATLLEHAGDFDATDLARTGRHLVHVVDPDAEDRMLEKQLDRQERASHLTRFFSITSDGAGGVRVRGRGSAEDGALIKAALLPLAAPAPAVDDRDGQLVHDPREASARMWDALVRTAQHALDTDVLPESHGAPARLMVTVSLDALRTGLADAASGELSVSTMRRLACDAEIIPAVLGTVGEPLDVGRVRRHVTLAIWAALVLRDRHCAFPGCDRPPLMCHAHHITHWISGGETKLSNLVMLCGHHHRVLHHSPWKVRIDPEDHRPQFQPPPKPGVTRHWIRYRPRLD